MSEPQATSHERQVIRLTELVDTPTSLITHRRFRDCDIYGPIVLLPLSDLSFVGCVFEAPADDLVIVLESGRRIFGVVGIQDVRFDGCRFHNVGFAAGREFLDAFAGNLQ